MKMLSSKIDKTKKNLFHVLRIVIELKLLVTANHFPLLMATENWYDKNINKSEGVFFFDLNRINQKIGAKFFQEFRLDFSSSGSSQPVKPVFENDRHGFEMTHPSKFKAWKRISIKI